MGQCKVQANLQSTLILHIQGTKNYFRCRGFFPDLHQPHITTLPLRFALGLLCCHGDTVSAHSSQASAELLQNLIGKKRKSAGGNTRSACWVSADSIPRRKQNSAKAERPDTEAALVLWHVRPCDGSRGKRRGALKQASGRGDGREEESSFMITNLRISKAALFLYCSSFDAKTYALESLSKRAND